PPALPSVHPLSLHDALPFCRGFLGPGLVLELVLPFFAAAGHREVVVTTRLSGAQARACGFGDLPTEDVAAEGREEKDHDRPADEDRKSTRLNSSHRTISYAV